MSIPINTVVNTINRVYGNGERFSSHDIANIFNKTPQDVTPSLTKLRRDNLIALVELGRPYYYKIAKFVSDPIVVDDTPKKRKSHNRKTGERTPEIKPNIPEEKKAEPIVGKMKFSISVTANEHNLDKLADLIKLAENVGLVIGEIDDKAKKKKKKNSINE